MIDLDAMKQQIEEAIPWRDGVLTVEQARALIAEVERLRAEVAELELGVATMRTRMNNAYQQRNDERAAVVAWLRRTGDEAESHMLDAVVVDYLRVSAAEIERGEHRREEVCAHGNTECRRCGVGPGCGEHRRKGEP
jgi:uncharacterized protein (UPF0335 family)